MLRHEAQHRFGNIGQLVAAEHEPLTASQAGTARTGRQDVIAAGVALRPIGLAVVMALFAAPAAHAADSTRWSRIASSREDLVDFYVDRANVAGGRTRTVRLLYDYRDVQQDPDTLAEHRSSIVTARFDCRSHTMAMVSIENFAKRMGRGARSGRQLQRAEMRPIAAGTIDDRIQKVVCGR